MATNIVILIVSEFVSILFLSIMLIGMLLQVGKKNTTAKLYILSVIIALFGCFIDMISYWLEGHLESVFLLTVINVFALGTTTISLAVFSYYVWSWINEKQPVSRWYARPIMVACALDFLIIVIGAINGKMFTIENGAYIAGNWEVASGVIQVIMLILFVVLILTKGKILGLRASMILCVYAIVPSVTAALQWLLIDISLVYVSIALVMTLIYVSLQRDEMEKGRLREKVMLEVSNTDALTCLNNRRAYDNCLGNLKADVPVSVVFCDLNGLKKANDQYGHAAGDALIRRFSDMMREFFAASEVFRISGDEFVIISRDDPEAVRTHLEQFKTKNMDAGQISAIGAAYGIGKDVMKLIREAEKEMYIDKDAYYEKLGGRVRS